MNLQAPQDKDAAASSSSSSSSSSARYSTARIAVVQGAEPEDWKDIYDRLNNSSNRLSTLLLKSAAATATIASMLAVAATMGAVILHFFPGADGYHLAAAVMLPAALCGAAGGQAGGNLFLRLWFRMDDATRRGFATRLSLVRVSAEWPAHLRRWLFTGDWLGSPSYDLRLPYVRIFLTGDAPASCREEDDLWREIHANISGDSLWEAGTNIRQISYPQVLPDWARQVEKGDAFADLCGRIGYASANDWVGHLWRRACRQWPVLRACDNPAGAARKCFEMHSLELSDGRDALVVVLRPTAFVSSLTGEPLEEGALAA